MSDQPQQQQDRTAPKFGIFIAGDTTGRGEVETLAWQAWQGRPDNQPLRDCITSYLDCAQKAGNKLHSHDKTRIGALLAVLNDEDPRLGPGARANLFDFNAPEFAGLRKFLAEM